MPRNRQASELESQLGSSLQELREILALQVHHALLTQMSDDLWQVRKEGIPYEQVPDELRGLQRQEALEALEGILGHGFRIVPPSKPDIDPAVLKARAEAYIHSGEPFQAYDLIQSGLALEPGSQELRQLKAVALLQSGAPFEAIDLLEGLLREGVANSTALGLLARAHRELGTRTQQPSQRQAHFSRARTLYEELLQRGPSPWIGLHAAALALHTGDRARAQAQARDVATQCRTIYERLVEDGGDAFWILTILAQASLIHGGWAAARPHFMEVAEHGATRARDLAELRHDALRILRQLGQDASELEAILPVPRVVVFTGHMVDFPDRPERRFPPEAEGAVAEALKRKLDELDAWSGFASAAAGSQILFHEAMQARGAETHVVLPYDEETFLEDSVDYRGDGDWRARFAKVLSGARGLITASPHRLDEGSIAFRYNNELLLGLACLRARQLHADVIPLMLWDGVPSKASGSAAATFETWTSLGYEVRVMDLGRVTGIPLGPRTGPARPPRSESQLPRELRSGIQVMLFADVVHFSQLTDAQVPRFVDGFLGALHTLEESLSVQPVARNTWGDGLFYVFQGLGEAASFAQSLVDTVAQTRWAELGLPADLNLRVALHAGPVFSGSDPVTGRPTCFGTHVNRAARIEPITPPGQVYVSQAFAALAAAREIPGLLCEYVGQLPLAKGFGTFPMYLMRVLD